MQFTRLSTAREVGNFMLLSVVSKHIPIIHTRVRGKIVEHNLKERYEQNLVWFIGLLRSIHISRSRVQLLHLSECLASLNVVSCGGEEATFVNQATSLISMMEIYGQNTEHFWMHQTTIC